MQKLKILNSLTGSEFYELHKQDLSFTHGSRVWVYSSDDDYVYWKWNGNTISSRVHECDEDEQVFGPFRVNDDFEFDHLIEAVSIF